jgi:hypothetical protein
MRILWEVPLHHCRVREGGFTGGSLRTVGYGSSCVCFVSRVQSGIGIVLANHVRGSGTDRRRTNAEPLVMDCVCVGLPPTHA